MSGVRLVSLTKRIIERTPKQHLNGWNQRGSNGLHKPKRTRRNSKEVQCRDELGLIMKNKRIIDYDKVWKSTNCGCFKIIDYKNSGSVTIKFVSTGHEKVVAYHCIESGKVKDPTFPVVLGVGFIGVGEYKSSKGRKDTKAYVNWRNMLFRCYGKHSDERYKHYKDCVVCDEWHDFQVFAKWHYDNYPKDGNSYELDKDKLSGKSKIYSPETCCYISKRENTTISAQKFFSFISPRGVIVSGKNITHFAMCNNLSPKRMHGVMLGTEKHHKGWTANRMLQER